MNFDFKWKICKKIKTILVEVDHYFGKIHI
jgi:hypothetical protein